MALELRMELQNGERKWARKENENLCLCSGYLHNSLCFLVIWLWCVWVFLFLNYPTWTCLSILELWFLFFHSFLKLLSHYSPSTSVFSLLLEFQLHVWQSDIIPQLLNHRCCFIYSFFFALDNFYWLSSSSETFVSCAKSIDEPSKGFFIAIGIGFFFHF